MGVIRAWACILLAGAWLPAARAAIVVVYESGVEPYSEALEGLRAALGASAFRVADINAGPGDNVLAQALGAVERPLVIAVGSRALAAVQARNIALPLVATMVLHAGEALPGGGQVELDIPLAAQLVAMRELLPGRLRAGIIRNPARSPYSAEALESQARKEGYTAVIVDSDGPARLVKAVSAFKGKVDFLLCYPDPDLYNPVTIKPVVLASLENRVPIVGFSPAFVRAGAAAGIYPDYREIGLQAGEMALRLLRGEDRAGAEAPRKIRLAVNQRVARLLGMEFRTGPGVEVFR